MATQHVAVAPAARFRNMDVDPWTDRLSGFVERHPGLLIRVGDFETRALRETIEGVVIDRPIYLAGLARSGSTILLELLARHGDTATHRYRDFPMLFTPWAWNWFVDRAGRNGQPARERAHRDRIAVTPDSPEAFEEVIWMAFFSGLHDEAQSAVLDGQTRNPRFEAFYRDHMRKMLTLRRGRRYLAKGNYNVTRLGYLKRLSPDARFVIPIRDPVWHVASLMKQHALFCREEKRDRRVQSHMRRAGHFEFGLDRRATNTGDTGAVREIRDLWMNGREAEGWALYWSVVYGHVRTVLDADPALSAATIIVRYEDFCERPGKVLSRILDHCSLAPSGLPAIADQMIRPPDYYRPTFTQSELDAIRDRSRLVAEAFGYPQVTSTRPRSLQSNR